MHSPAVRIPSIGIGGDRDAAGCQRRGWNSKIIGITINNYCFNFNSNLPLQLICNEPEENERGVQRKHPFESIKDDTRIAHPSRFEPHGTMAASKRIPW